MARLNKEQKLFVTQRLACFETPAEVIKALKDSYGVTISPQALQAYDPGKVNGQEMSKDLVAVFQATRKQFLEDTSDIAISHKSVRLRTLQRLIAQAETRGNAPLAAQLLEQAAKEMGGAFTNRRELSGPNGAPIEAKVATQTLDPKKLTDDEIKAFLAARISDQPPANH